MKVETKTLVKIGLAVFITYMAISYWPNLSAVIAKIFEALVPLIIGCGIAYVINLIMSLYEKWYFPKSEKKFVIKSRRPICLVLAILSLIALLTGIVIIVIPQLSSCVSLLFEKIPAALTDLAAKIEDLAILPDNIADSIVAIDWQSMISNVAGTLTSGVTNIVGIIVKVVSSVAGGFLTAFLSIMFSVYLLLAKETLTRQSKNVLQKILKPRLYKKTENVLSIANETFRGYVIGQCAEALILGVLCSLGMWIFGLPYYAMIGAVIAFTALVPIAGAYIGGAIGAFMIFTVEPIQAIIFVVFLVILQQIEGNLIYPRVVGNSVGLPAIWVLVAITIGGGIMGIVGMLLGVPIAAVIYKVLTRKSEAEQPEETPAAVAEK